MNTVFKFLKKFIINIVLKMVFSGAILGVLVGGLVGIVGYVICDLYQLSYIKDLLTSPDIYDIATLYFGCWASAGLIAKVLPW